MEKDIIKHYTKGDLTIVWKPSACIHSKNCWNSVTGMPQVFDPRKRPWVNLDGGPAPEAIAEQVKKCPSGALSVLHDKAAGELPDGQTVAMASPSIPTAPGIRVPVLPNGPLLVKGHCEVIDASGNKQTKTDTTAFCRCGFSANKPYCDGSHTPNNFVG